MIFQKLSLEYYSFSKENISDIKNLLQKGLAKTREKFLSTKKDKIMSEFTSEEMMGSIYDPDNFKMNSGSRPSHSEATMELEADTTIQRSMQSKGNKKNKRKRRRD